MGQCHFAHPVLFREIGRELPEQQIDVRLALPQGRHGYLNGIEPVIQVLPEFPLRYCIEQIHVRGGDYPYVRLADFGRAHPYIFTRLKHSEQLRLGRQRKFSDLVEEQCSAVGLLEIALSRLYRTGKRTFFMTEKFRVNGPFRYRSTVHREIFGILPPSELMDNLRYVVLSDAAFSRNEYGQVRRRHCHGHFQGPVQCRVITYNIVFILESL